VPRRQVGGDGGRPNKGARRRSSKCVRRAGTTKDADGTKDGVGGWVTGMSAPLAWDKDRRCQITEDSHGSR